MGDAHHLLRNTTEPEPSKASDSEPTSTSSAPSFNASDWLGVPQGSLIDHSKVDPAIYGLDSGEVGGASRRATDHLSGKGVPLPHLQAMQAASSPGPTDPMLVSETHLLQFPKTVVGSVSTSSIVVRNDDVQPLVLDGIRAARTSASRADAFHEVKPLLDQSVLLRPGERHAIAIQFWPARAARIEQVLELVAGSGPVGPEEDIRVVGEGIDLPYNTVNDDTATSSESATEDRIVDQGHEIEANARANDHLAKPRKHVEEVVDQWRVKAMRYTDSLAQWTIDNWLDFYSKTGGDHVLHGSAAVADGWKRAVARAGKVLVKMGRRAAIKATGVEYPVLRQGLEEVFDRIGKFLLDKIGLEEDPIEASDEHALEATRNTGGAGVRKVDEIFSYKANANLAIEDSASGARLQISRSETPEELADWEAWARSEVEELPPLLDSTNRALSDILLQQWVLEHAGTPTAPNASTNAKAWNAARGELKNKGMLSTLQRNDLFIHQCRQEWGYLGLVEAEEMAARLDAERQHFEAGARSVPNTDASVAGQVAAGITGGANRRLVTFTRTTNPAHLAKVFGAQQYLLGPEKGNGIHGMEIFGTEFVLDCDVEIVSHEGAVFVQAFLYSVRGRDQRHYTGIHRSPGQP